MKTKTLFNIAMLLVIAIVVMSIAISFKLDKLNKELAAAQNELSLTQEELAITQKKYQAEVEKSASLNKELNKIANEFDSVNTELEKATSMILDLKNDEYKLVYIGEYKLTHYCVEKREHICGTGTGLTATGTRVTAGRSIAVDPSVIPYGSKVYVEGYGWRVAEDCGGGVDGKHIDIAVETHSQALKMGTKTGGVWILVKNNT